MPKVSVIIPTYNLARYLEQAIESVLGQTYSDLELIIVDDGSTDETREMMARFGDRTRYLYQANQGVAAARNTGIAAARGQYLAFLDADDLWLPDKLALQISRLQARPEIGMIYGDVHYLEDGTGVIAGRHQEQVPHPTGWLWPQIILRNPIPSPTPVVQREVMEAVGGFDVSLARADDWECWIRIARIREIDCIEQPIALYRLHGGQTYRDYVPFHQAILAVLAKVFADPTLPEEVRVLQRVAFSSAYTDFGTALFERGLYDQAWKDLLRAVRLDPRRLTDWQVLGRLLLLVLGGGGRWTDSLRALRRALTRRCGQRPPRS